MGRISVGMHEADRDAFRASCQDFWYKPSKRALIKNGENISLRIGALWYREAAATRHQRGGLFNHHVVLVVTALVADLQNIAKAFCGDQRRRRALAFDNGVGGQRGAVKEDA